MTIYAPRQALALYLVFFLFFLSGCASKGGGENTTEQTTPETATVPTEIADNVAFWRNVYGEWSRSQVAIHDDEYLGVIYEVAQLPGPTHAGYTPEQKQIVKARKTLYRNRLKDLERKVWSHQSLSPNERALQDKLVDAGGSRAVFGASERVHSQRGLRERFRRGVEISGRYDAAFRAIFRAKGLPEELAYLPHVESSFQVNARSSAGAAGVWQFTRGTGKIYLMVNRTIDERLDPIIAAEGAARYLRDAHRKLGSWPLAITSYNHGVGGMMNAKAIYGDDIGKIVRQYKGRYFKFASRNFYSEFLAAKEVASNPKKYFPEGINYMQPMAEDRLVLRQNMPAHHVAHHYGVSTYKLADLNLHWRRPAVQGRAYLPAGSTVWLPKGSLQRVASAPAAPPPIMIAKAKRPEKQAKTRQRVKLAKSDQKAKRAKQSKGKKTRHHVVKPNETLYRVAMHYDMSVAELRRLNGIRPDNNTIRPGQRLRVRS